jgi:monovalent cation/hydrogen antiporter
VHTVALLVLLVIGVVAVSRLAAALRIPPPVLLVLAGLVVGALPWVPEIEIEPDLALFVLLPPLLFAVALGSSYVGLRDVRRPVLLLAVGLVLVTAFAVAFALNPLVPGLSFAAALSIGAIVAPPDAVSATAIARRTGMPRRTVTILEGESLFNDATALTVLKIAVAATAAGSVTAAEVGRDFVVAAAGGAVVGVAGAYGLGWLRRQGIDILSGIALSLAAPFGAYLAAEEFGGSGVIAVVVMGLILGHRSPVDQGPEARITDASIWRSVQFVLEGAVFALIGLQLPAIVGNVTEPAGLVVASCAVTLGVVVVARPIWIFGIATLARVMPILDLGRPRWSSLAVTSWAGMRGVVSLAAAQSLPLDFPHRDLALLVAVVVIFGTLVLQGLTLPGVIRLVGVQPQDPRLDALAIASAQEDAVEAALRRLDELAAEQAVPARIVEKLRIEAERRSLVAWERLGRSDGGEPPSRSYQRVRREMLNAERDVFIRLRDSGDLDDDVLRQVQLELDLEETLLLRRARVEAATDRELPAVSSARAPCPHLAAAPVSVQTRSTGCEGCEAEGRNDWVHLRTCLACGYMGCCDSSPRRHARLHYGDEGHPVIRSAEPGESWRWCFVDRELG